MDLLVTAAGLKELVAALQALGYSIRLKMATSGLRGVRILAPVPAEYSSILTPEALAFVAHLARCYGKRVDALLAQRQVVQARYDAGVKPDFLPETRHVRESDWQVQPGRRMLTPVMAEAYLTGIVPPLVQH